MLFIYIIPIMSSPSDRAEQQHTHTPLRGYIRGLYTRSSLSQNQITQQTGVPQRTVSRIVTQRTSRRTGHHRKQLETRGRPKRFTKEKVNTIEEYLNRNGFEGKQTTWESLLGAIGLTEDWSLKTVKRELVQKSWRRCLAYRKGWCDERLAAQRIRFAEDMLRKRSDPDDWKDVRFSDESHFGWGPSKTARITRKIGTRYCPDCLQLDQKKEPKESDKKRFHIWAAIGWNFKSDLVFYDVPGNSNGKMSQSVYRDHILEPIVKPWLAKSSFVLEEDGDSGHGFGSSKNIVAIWKEQNQLEYYKNCPGSPDLSPIENCWLPPKQYYKKWPKWDDFGSRELIQEGWDRVTQPYINAQILSIPKRLNDVLKLDG